MRSSLFFTLTCCLCLSCSGSKSDDDGGSGGTSGKEDGGGSGEGGTGSGKGGSSGSSGKGGSGAAESGGSGGGPAGASVLERNNHPSRNGMFVQPSLSKAMVSKMALDTGFAATFKGNMWASPLYFENGPGGKGVFFSVTTGND
ncbi:MAG TPA: hypothetical protein VJR89_28905, partial [Polyangiales bacterium]|nr:hypothetical protein [Polyangiales bacterium]